MQNPVMTCAQSKLNALLIRAALRVFVKIRAKETRVKMLAPKNRYKWEGETVMAACFNVT